MLGDKVIRRKYDVSNKCVQNLNELYNLYSERHPLSLDPRFKCGKKKKKHLNKGKKCWKKPQEEPSPRADRHAIDVACTEKSNKITVYKLH